MGNSEIDRPHPQITQITQILFTGLDAVSTTSR